MSDPIPFPHTDSDLRVTTGEGETAKSDGGWSLLSEGLQLEDEEEYNLMNALRLRQEESADISSYQSMRFDHLLKRVCDDSAQGMQKFSDIAVLCNASNMEASLRKGLMRFIQMILSSNDVVHAIIASDVKYEISELGSNANMDAQMKTVSHYYDLSKTNKSGLNNEIFTETDRKRFFSLFTKKYCFLSVCSEILQNITFNINNIDGEMLTTLPTIQNLRHNRFILERNHEVIEIDFMHVERIMRFSAGSHLSESRNKVKVMFGNSKSESRYETGEGLNPQVIFNNVSMYTQRNTSPFSKFEYTVEMLSVSVPLVDSKLRSEMIEKLLSCDIINVMGVKSKEGIINHAFFSIHSGSLRRKQSKHGMPYINVVVTIYPTLQSLLCSSSSDVMRMSYTLAENILFDYHRKKLYEKLPFYIDGPERNLMMSDYFHDIRFASLIENYLRLELVQVKHVQNVESVEMLMPTTAAFFEYICSCLLVNGMNKTIGESEGMLVNFAIASTSVISSIDNTILAIKQLQANEMKHESKFMDDLIASDMPAIYIAANMTQLPTGSHVLTYVNKMQYVTHVMNVNDEHVKMALNYYIGPFLMCFKSYNFSLAVLEPLSFDMEVPMHLQLREFQIKKLIGQKDHTDRKSMLFSASKDVRSKYNVSTDEELMKKFSEQSSNTDLSLLLTKAYDNISNFPSEDMINPLDAKAINIGSVGVKEIVINGRTAKSSDTIKLFRSIDGKRYIMSIRGTYDKSDALLDHKIIQSLTFTSIKLNVDKHPRVQEAQKVYDVLKESDKQVFVIGHSLGGWLASNLKGVREGDIIISYNKLTNKDKVKANEVSIRIFGDIPSYLSKSSSINRRRSDKRKFNVSPLKSTIDDVLKVHEIQQIQGAYFI